jgi:CheY-like chemotaxis protein
MPLDGESELFLNQVRRALQHLYDPVELSHSLLQKMLPLDPAVDRVTALRKALQEAVQALRPEENIPADSNAWRIHDVLSYRFIEQSSQREVAADMSLSIRQLQRLETTALQVLCDYLISHYKLELHAPDTASTADTGTGETPLDPQDAVSKGMALSQEYDWLKKSSPDEEISIAQLVESTLSTIAPMIQAMGAQVEVDIPPAMPGVHGQLTILRQALINLFTAALQIARNGRVILAARPNLPRVLIQITSLLSDAVPLDLLKPDVDEFISVARQLSELSGGILTIQPQHSALVAFETTLSLPGVQRVTVLVIDDNNDTLLLLERYLSGTRYQFVSGRDPVQLFALIETHHPNIIVLDVMLPGIDGWELLGRIKGNPDTRLIPVIISTILPQESLAMMLGAADFLRKPFTQARFLEVLEQQTAQQTPE